MALSTHPELIPVWRAVCTELRDAVGEATFDIWLAALEPCGWDGSVLLLQAPTATQGWLAGRYGHILEHCARTVLGSGVSVVFTGEAGAPARGSRSTRPAAPLAGGPLPDGEPLIPRYTFEQFIIGDGNRLAHAAALAVAEAPGQTYNPLFLHAPPGLGKTHLLHAIGNYITAFQPGSIVRYTTVEAFTNSFIAALNARVIERFKHLYRGVDVLLIDDVQFLASKARTEEEFFHTFNALYDSGRQLVLTCDRLPRQLVGVEERLCERFEAGLVATLSVPDRATRIAILRKRALLDQLTIPDDAVLELIADRVTDNVRSLEGALIRIVAHHSLTGRPITLALARDLLDDIHPCPPATAALTIERIADTVAGHFGLSSTDLSSSARTAQVTWARQLAIHLSRTLTNASLQAIGHSFGGRNHATVLHACRRVQERVHANTEDSTDLEVLTRLLS